MHTDAAQSAGKVATDVGALGVDLLSLAGHKIYAPKGIGALWIGRGTAIAPLLHGGGQEGGLRPGTEPVPAIVGLGAACALLAGERAESAARLGALRDRLESGLAARVPDVRINGADAPRVPRPATSASSAGTAGCCSPRCRRSPPRRAPPATRATTRPRRSSRPSAPTRPQRGARCASPSAVPRPRKTSRALEIIADAATCGASRAQAVSSDA